jgi:DNA-binding transcriptional ArsR family regulator
MTTADNDLDRLAHAVADPTRRRIIERLLASPGLTTGQLATSAPQVTRFAVMKHLEVLRTTGLLRTMSDGRRRRHYLEQGGLDALRAWLEGLSA